MNLRHSFTIFAKLILNIDISTISFDDLLEIPFGAKIKTQANTKKFLISTDNFAGYFIENYKEIKHLVDKGKFKMDVFTSFFDFTLEVLGQMQEILPFHQEFLQESEEVFLGSKNFNKAAWKKLGSKFTNIIGPNDERGFLNDIERFEIAYDNIQKTFILSRWTPLEIWNHLAEEYPFMGRLARAIMVLPHSSVPVERVFSNMKDIKTAKRNRITAENLEAALLVYQKFGEGDSQITPAMLANYDRLYNEATEELNDKDSEIQEEEFKDHEKDTSNCSPQEESKVGEEQSNAVISPEEIEMLIKNYLSTKHKTETIISKQVEAYLQSSVKPSASSSTSSPITLINQIGSTIYTPKNENTKRRVAIDPITMEDTSIKKMKTIESIEEPADENRIKVELANHGKRAKKGSVTQNEVKSVQEPNTNKEEVESDHNSEAEKPKKVVVRGTRSKKNSESKDDAVFEEKAVNVKKAVKSRSNSRNAKNRSTSTKTRK